MERLRAAFIDFRDEFLLAFGLKVIRPEDDLVLRILEKRVNNMYPSPDSVAKMMNVFGRDYSAVESWARMNIGRWNAKR